MKALRTVSGNNDPRVDAAAACAREAIRRQTGDDPDPRFDVPLAMLADLADELGASGDGIEMAVVVTGANHGFVVIP